MKLEKILKKVPDYKEFLTIDELNYSSEVLAKKNRKLIELIEIGESSEGEKIPMLKIGEGSHTALLFGFPHPDEPIGSMMLESLSHMLVKNRKLRKELDFTWLIIKCIDPGGARLNEGWFKGRFTPLKCALNYYRPPFDEQVEWTFPVDYKRLHFHKALPETKALMDVIKDFKPDFMYSLHSGGFGGVYFFVSDDWKELYPKFRNLVKSEELPLHLGEPEAMFMKKFDEAVFKCPVITEAYDYYEEQANTDPLKIIKFGTSSMDYLKSVCDGFGLICEVPHFYDPAIEDNSTTNVRRREALLEKIEKKEEVYNFLKPAFEKLQEDADRNTRLFRSISNYINTESDWLSLKKEEAKTASYDGKATKAQLFDLQVESRYYDMLKLGKFLRVVKEAYNSTKKLYLKNVGKGIYKKILNLNEEISNNSQIQIIPIQKLVRVQLGSALEVVKGLAEGL